MIDFDDDNRSYVLDGEATEHQLGIRRCAYLIREITARLVDGELPSAASDELHRLLTEARDAALSDPGTGSPDHMPRSEIHPWVGPSNPVAPPMRLHLEDDVLVGLVTCSHVYCIGERVHGGVIAGLFDTMVATRGAFSGAPTTAKLAHQLSETSSAKSPAAVGRPG